VRISGDISVGERCRLHVAADTVISGVAIELRNGAETVIGESCRFDTQSGSPSSIGIFASKAEFGRNAQIQACAKLIAQSGSDLCVGAGSLIRNVALELSEGGVVDIGPGCMFDCPAGSKNEIVVQAGKVILPERVRLQADVLVRFGGELKIGKYTGIGHRSEIRCEERISIGEYCMISYGVAIFDTNTHSTDWRERRDIALRSFPIGAHEPARPDTLPILIGDDVWVGMGASILKGVTLGDRCIVGMRAMVTRGAYAAGSAIVAQPPRVIPPRDGT
jgi:acetyltransferase-like isoleucine patch superfamily enzyme